MAGGPVERDPCTVCPSREFHPPGSLPWVSWSLLSPSCSSKSLTIQSVWEQLPIDQHKPVSRTPPALKYGPKVLLGVLPPGDGSFAVPRAALPRLCSKSGRPVCKPGSGCVFFHRRLQGTARVPRAEPRRRQARSRRTSVLTGSEPLRPHHGPGCRGAALTRRAPGWCWPPKQQPPEGRWSDITQPLGGPPRGTSSHFWKEKSHLL